MCFNHFVLLFRHDCTNRNVQKSRSPGTRSWSE